MHDHKRTILKSFVTNRVRQLLFLRKYKIRLIMQHGTDLSKTVWDPLKIFHCPAHYKHAVVILNRPLCWKHDIILRLWQNGMIFVLESYVLHKENHEHVLNDLCPKRFTQECVCYLAQINVTVDGGTERWLHYLEEQGVDLLTGKYDGYVPNLITGDMDSCSPLILEKLKSMGSTIIHTPDQNHSDYTKALLQLGQYAKGENINLDGVYVFVDSSGRFDHIIGNINTLHKSDKLIGDTQVIQVASNSLTWILKPGFHSIAIPNILVQNNSWCGLLPIGAPVNSITTTGLKWNLNNATMQFGGVVSSSNTYDNCSEVTISTDSPVIWTMGIEPLVEIMDNYEIPL